MNDDTLLSERIRRALADDIASGAIPEGTALEEQQIAARFAASRTPVREALRMLTADSLIEMRPRRGAIVATLSIERIIEMFDMAAELEAMCVRLATNRMNPLERARVLRIHLESEEAVAQGDVDRYSALNLVFHEAIYQGTHNSLIAEQALGLRSRMAAFRRAQLFEPGRPVRSRGEHESILDAIMKGDGEEAARRMRAHMLNAASVIMERHIKAPTAEKSGKPERRRK